MAGRVRRATGSHKLAKKNKPTGAVGKARIEIAPIVANIIANANNAHAAQTAYLMLPPGSLRLQI